MQTIPLRRVIVPLAASLFALGAPAFAAELPEGTVISKENIDKVMNDTFMGHKISDLLTERMQWFVRTYNKKYPLTKAPEPQLDAKYIEATKKYSSQVKLDPQTREITGYVAGMPFPNIDPSDPSAGDKVIWNFYLGAPSGADVVNTTYFLTANKSGFEASQKWTFQRIWSKNRLWGEEPFPNEPTAFTKTILVGLQPQDVRGVGTFTVQYDEANKLDDLWAYIKSARRVRRLSGNSWMDNVGGFDFLNDDVSLWNSRPSRYQSVKLVGKRWILAATNFEPERVKGKEGTGEEWANLNFKDAPYLMSTQKVSPREVWMVEGTPPDGHPYGKKVAYVDVKLPAVYHTEVYDKNDHFWRMMDHHFSQRVGAKSGIRYYYALGGEMLDFKAMHGTFWTAESRVDVGLNPIEHTVEKLERLQ